jgi:hypothetical protein
MYPLSCGFWTIHELATSTPKPKYSFGFISPAGRSGGVICSRWARRDRSVPGPIAGAALATSPMVAVMISPVPIDHDGFQKVESSYG